MKVGMLCYSNHSGLGNQSRRLCKLLNPYRILAIDSTPFARNKQLNWDWYKDYQGYITNGFPTNKEIRAFCKDLTHVFMIENPLNTYLLTYCDMNGVKTYIQTNPEYCDHFNDSSLDLPTKFLLPSPWMKNLYLEKFGAERVELLPPPIEPEEFAEPREANLNRKGGKLKLLHIIGNVVQEDRNGTLDLIAGVQRSTADFELVIRSQSELPEEYIISDPRVRYIIEDTKDVPNMYKDYDAMILPRRYGGLCLPCNEALMSALPVFMPGISPNEILPSEWRMEARFAKTMQTRLELRLYQTPPDVIAHTIYKLSRASREQIQSWKKIAYRLALDKFSPAVLTHRYEALKI